MSGELTLFVVAAVIYLAECCVWCDPDATVFAGWRRGAWRVRRAAFVPMGDRGGFWIAPLLPPFQTQVRCAPWPFALGRDGVDVAGRTFSYDEIADAHVDGKSLVFARATRVRTASARTALHLLEVIRRIASLDAERRIDAIRAVLRSAFNSVQARKALKQFQKAVGRLRLASHVLFWYVFAAAPIIVWQFGLPGTWIALAAGLAALTVVTVGAFVLAHGRLTPDRRQNCFSEALMLAIAPIAAMRAVDKLAWLALIDYHPLTVAAVLADRETFVTAGRRDRFDAARLARQFEGTASASWYRWTLEEIDGCLDRSLARSEALAAPRAEDGSSRSYCPRCGDQYVAPEGRCAGCEDVELIPFDVKAPKGL